MNIEEFDKFGEKLNSFMQNRERSETEQIHEVMAAVTIFTVKECSFEEALNMIKQSVKSLAVEHSFYFSSEITERNYWLMCSTADCRLMKFGKQNYLTQKGLSVTRKSNFG